MNVEHIYCKKKKTKNKDIKIKKTLKNEVVAYVVAAFIYYIPGVTYFGMYYEIVFNSVDMWILTFEVSEMENLDMANITMCQTKHAFI